MMTFLTIFIILAVINIVMVVASLLNVSRKTKTTKQKLATPSTSVIYPLDLLAANYKKAV